MIITNIKLENWKNFPSVNVKCGKRVFIIGANASGKSNFLDALRFMRDVAQNGLEKAVTERGGLKSIRYLEARKPSNVTIEIIINDTWEYSLTLGTEKSKKSEPLVKKEVVRRLDATGGGKQF